MYSEDFTQLIIALGVCVILPITIVTLVLQHKSQSERHKKDIILAALEKNANIDIEDLVKQMNKPRKSVKQKLLGKLNSGLVLTFIGLCLLLLSLISAHMGSLLNDKQITTFSIGGGFCLAIGVAELLSYHIGKKQLTNEIEAEESQTLRQ